MKQGLLKHVSAEKLVLAVGDAGLIVSGLLLTSIVSSSPFTVDPWRHSWWLSIPTFLFLFYLANLYMSPSGPGAGNKIVARIVLAVLAATTVVGLLSYVAPKIVMGRKHLLLLALFILPSVYVWRRVFPVFFTRLLHPARAVVLGTGGAAQAIGSILTARNDCQLLGYVEMGEASENALADVIPLIGHVQDLAPIVEKHQPDMLVLAVQQTELHGLWSRLLACKMRGVECSSMADLYEEMTGKVPVQYIHDSWFVFGSLRGLKHRIYTQRGKRALEMLLALVGLVFSSPIFILAGLAVVCESGFPIFYRQRRVGQNEAVFWLYKFRSMAHGAEWTTGPVWACPGDRRVTRVGRILRALRVDELPQLWHVITGDMSFIGPRPERPEFVEMLKQTIPYFSIRHTIKPGITGWAQVNYPYGASEADALEKLQYDLFYLKNMSLLLDLHILLRTVRVVFGREGSR